MIYSLLRKTGHISDMAVEKTVELTVEKTSMKTVEKTSMKTRNKIPREFGWRRGENVE